MSDPDSRRALEQYRRHAPGYDASARRTMDIRRRTVALLALAPGERVLDVDCGTGLSFPLLAEAVGPSGRVTGVEVSPEMAAQARARVAAAGWTNVSVVEASVESATLEGLYDALLFHYTHDVLQSPTALARVFAHARRGARVAVAGVKHLPRWLYPARLYTLWKARPYLTTFRGLERPWVGLDPYVEGLEVTPVRLGTNYIASGRVRVSATMAP
ncbi:MAG: class I SAM-dependent methyltransferase [Burkholderiales bacterium]